MQRFDARPTEAIVRLPPSGEIYYVSVAVDGPNSNASYYYAFRVAPLTD